MKKEEIKGLILVTILMLSIGGIGIMIGLNIPDRQIDSIEIDEDIVLRRSYYGTVPKELLNETLDITANVSMSIGNYYILRWGLSDMVRIDLNDNCKNIQLLDVNYTVGIMIFKVIESNPIVIVDIIGIKALSMPHMLTLQLLKL